MAPNMSAIPSFNAPVSLAPVPKDPADRTSNTQCVYSWPTTSTLPAVFDEVFAELVFPVPKYKYLFPLARRPLYSELSPVVPLENVNREFACVLIAALLPFGPFNP